MRQLAYQGILVVCSILGHVMGRQLHLCASAHYRIVDAHASFACAGSDPATNAEVSRVLRAKDAAYMLSEGVIEASHALKIGFAHEVHKQHSSECALLFACWAARQPPVGLRHMLQLLCSSGKTGVDCPWDGLSLKTEHGWRLRNELGYRELSSLRSSHGLASNSHLTASPVCSAAEDVRLSLREDLLCRLRTQLSLPASAGVVRWTCSRQPSPSHPNPVQPNPNGPSCTKVLAAHLIPRYQPS